MRVPTKAHASGLRLNNPATQKPLVFCLAEMRRSAPAESGVSVETAFARAQVPLGKRDLLADAESAENAVEDVVGVHRAYNLANFVEGHANLGRDDLVADSVGYGLPGSGDGGRRQP